MRMQRQVIKRARIHVLLFVLLVLVAACGRARSVPIRLPTPAPDIRHRDALPLMLTTDDLGTGYQVLEERRLERGKGWGEDTTRLSGYRTVFEGSEGVFSRVSCEVECYLLVKDAQEAYQAHGEALAAELRGNTAYESMQVTEERMLGDWNQVFTTRAQGTMTVHYVLLRENVLVTVALTGPESSGFPDQAVRQAELLDERIYR